MVAEALEVVEVLGDLGQLEAALNAGLDSKVRLGLRGVGVCLFVGVDHAVVGDAEAVDVGGDAPVVQLSGGILYKAVSTGVPSEQVQ